MARKVEEIYNEMVAEKQSFAELAELMPQYNQAAPANDNPFAALINEVASVSKVAIWRLWFYLVATGIYTLESLFDAFIVEAEQLAAQSIAGNLKWYAAQVLAWQYGYSLVFNGTSYRYYYADTTTPAAIAARLVAKVSVRDVPTQTGLVVQIKVAKLNGTTLVPLDTTFGTELTSLNDYINTIKFAGVQTSVISIPSDKVRLNLRLYYDGTLVLANLQPLVETALKSFLRNIDFDGVLYLTQLTDAIQAIPGIVSPWVFINSVQCKADTDPAYTAVTESYNPASGYFELVPIGNNPATDTFITYIPV